MLCDDLNVTVADDDVRRTTGRAKRVQDAKSEMRSGRFGADVLGWENPSTRDYMGKVV